MKSGFDAHAADDPRSEQPSDDANAISIQNLTKIYPDGTLAVDDISFEVAEGDFCVLIGPSGCGKSTTLHTIAGIKEATDGLIEIYGENIADIPSYNRNIGLVFQDFQLFPHMTVEENIQYGTERDSTAATRGQTVSDIVDLMQIDDLLDEYPATLSAGQQQRVALARSVALNPAVLLFDEPLGDLDYKLQRVMEREIMRLHQELDTTIIYVTHDQTQAMRLADQVVVMNDGKIEQSGTVEEVYRRPTTAFVAAFVGDSNIFEGKVVAVDRNQETVDIQTEYRTFTVDGANYDGRDLTSIKGDSVTFAVRPQDMALATDESLENRLTCEVVDVIERVKGGAKCFLRTVSQGGQEKELQLNTLQQVATEQSELSVGWTTENAILLTETSVIPEIDIEKDILGE
jgi:ABC-type Fe3+/spermidine/putrescine transport system ATPase subunit